MAARRFAGFIGACASEVRSALSLNNTSCGTNGATLLSNLSCMDTVQSISEKIRCYFICDKEILISGSGTKILLSRSRSCCDIKRLYYGWQRLIFSYTFWVVSAVNGVYPETISTMSTPRLQTSTSYEWPEPLNISGAIYTGVPQFVTVF